MQGIWDRCLAFMAFLGKGILNPHSLFAGIRILAGPVGQNGRTRQRDVAERVRANQFHATMQQR
jgi:hypothetical protein